MGALHHHHLLLQLFTFSLLTISFVKAHNITAMLSPFPEYSEFNNYLSQTKLADDINSRSTVTVLVLDNSAMSALATKHPISVIKNALSIHVLLDYWDAQKLHQISDGTTLSTTLYQTTGNAHGNLGFVNITDLKGGKVGFGSAVPGSKLDSLYSKSVKQIPYNISVVEIDTPISAPGILDATVPAASDVNIAALLEKAGCKTFVKLITDTGVLKVYQTAIDKGLTVFAPLDEAFKASGMPDLNKLSNAELVSLLQYHALASYSPKGTLKTTKGPLSTLATNGAEKYDLTVTTAGDSVTLDSGIDTSRIASTVIDTTPLSIFTVDSLLLPVELFGTSPSSSPAPAPAKSPSPAPSPARLAPEPATAPSPFVSPPAPPTATPAGAPADSPTADSQDSSSDNVTGGLRVPAMLIALVTVSVTIAISSLMF